MGNIIDSYVYRGALSNNYGFLQVFTGGLLILALILWTVFVILITGALITWLWNITVTKIFGIREIRFREGLSLVLIVWLLSGKLFNIIPFSLFFSAIR